MIKNSGFWCRPVIPSIICYVARSCQQAVIASFFSTTTSSSSSSATNSSSSNNFFIAIHMNNDIVLVAIPNTHKNTFLISTAFSSSKVFVASPGGIINALQKIVNLAA
uniref:Uncharacterized protein n=1 Tax=Heterosigma akashiwo TaxID=2829 RepID=A0A6V1V2L3_HETAK|mmetsp:Transcript_43441/g.75193  ORF Transcript_43441/g.75193 Transcript_43441/m.75193 type:complete len:108 (+) Transcript_43441:459-782(+)